MRLNFGAGVAAKERTKKPARFSTFEKIESVGDVGGQSDGKPNPPPLKPDFARRASPTFTLIFGILKLIVLHSYFSIFDFYSAHSYF